MGRPGPAPPAYWPYGPGVVPTAGPDGRRMSVTAPMSPPFGGLDPRPSGSTLQSRPQRTSLQAALHLGPGTSRAVSCFESPRHFHIIKNPIF